MNAETVEECFESKCTYIGGPYPAGTFVSYGANAYDGAGNRAWTDYKSVHISEPMDIIPPTVIDNTPVGTDVPVTTEITITFSESMNMELTEDAFSMYDSGESRVPGDFYWKENMVIFKPHFDLDQDTEYIVNLEGGNWGAMDLAENILVRSYNWGFRTSSPELLSPAAILSASATQIKEGYEEGINTVSDSIFVELLPSPTLPLSPTSSPSPALTPEPTPTPTPLHSWPIVPIAIAMIAALQKSRLMAYRNPR